VGGKTYSCTQGLVVAISQGDDGTNNTYAPGQLPADVTQSIGRRVGNDAIGFLVGLAGLGSVKNVSWLATGTTLNTISYAPSSIYPGAYLLVAPAVLTAGHRCAGDDRGQRLAWGPGSRGPGERSLHLHDKQVQHFADLHEVRLRAVV